MPYVFVKIIKMSHSTDQLLFIKTNKKREKQALI